MLQKVETGGQGEAGDGFRLLIGSAWWLQRRRHCPCADGTVRLLLSCCSHLGEGIAALPSSGACWVSWALARTGRLSEPRQ